MSAQQLTYPRAAGESLSAPFGRIICGIDGSPSSLQGALQAACLAGPDTTIELVAITDQWGSGSTAGALLSEPHARDALSHALSELADCPADVTTRTIKSLGRRSSDKLLEAATDADLLVVGRHGHRRLGGIFLGSTATHMLHRAPLPVLVAVRPPAGKSFPGRIVVAADGPGHPEDAIRIAGAIAAHSDGDVALVRVGRSRSAEVSDAVADLAATTGVQPLEVVAEGKAHRALSSYVEDERASLLITGSRGLRSLAALRSVSERLAHASPCSVLVVRHDAPDSRS